MLVRLLGVPVVVMAMPGDRIDAAHDLVYQAADHILRRGPESCTSRRGYGNTRRRRPTSEESVGSTGVPERRDPLTVTRMCLSSAVPAVPAGVRGRKALRRCASTVAMGVPWCAGRSVGRRSVAGSVHRRRGDLVGRSEFVADIAAAGRPAIIIPAGRPFAEQHATASALERGGDGVGSTPLARPRGLATADRARPGLWPRRMGALADPGSRRPRSSADRTCRQSTFHRGDAVKTAVITAARGRTPHLRKQLEGLAHSALPVDRHVVVAIDDDDAAGGYPPVTDDNGHPVHVDDGSDTHGRSTQPRRAGRARRRRRAVDFLDVDCIPAPDMVGRYVHAAQHPDHHDAPLCGPVTSFRPRSPMDTILPGCPPGRPASREAHT